MKTTNITKDLILGIIQKNPECTTEFIKKNGSVRYMRFTVDLARVPKIYWPKGTGKSRNLGLYSITVFDLEKHGWRVLNMDTMRWLKVVTPNSSTTYNILRR